MRDRRAEPPRWTPAHLDAASRAAVDAFIDGWEESARYRTAYQVLRPTVERLFSVTNDLAVLTGEALGDSAELVTAARFVAGPPVSNDDLQTLARVRLSKRLTPADADQATTVIRRLLDPFRYPWLAEARPPTANERAAAVNWTTSLIAVEKARTGRRTASSRRQEQATAQLLRNAGYVEATRLASLRAIDDLAKGHYLRETKIAGAKCDLPVRLHDGRLLAIECKVSNSSVNSVKRLNRETGGKAATWRHEFGQQVVVAAVLSGVFSLVSLLEAQNEQGVTLFWEHNLTPLMEFVCAAK